MPATRWLAVSRFQGMLPARWGKLSAPRNDAKRTAIGADRGQPYPSDILMPARLFPDRVPPQRIRTFLVLFALALALPLLALAFFALNRMASLEEQEIERRALQVAQDLAGDIDRELDRAMVTLETLATSTALGRGDFAAFREQASRALRRERAGILVVDRTYQQLLNTRSPVGAPLPPTSDPETAQRMFETKERQVSDLFMGVVSRQTHCQRLGARL